MRHPDKPLVPEVRELIRAYYRKPGNAAGGSLHLVLDDGNLDTASIRWVLKHATDEDDADGVLIAEKLLAMSRSGRGRAVRLT